MKSQVRFVDDTSVQPASAISAGSDHGYDAALLLRLAGKPDPVDALDHLAGILKARIGRGVRVLVSLQAVDVEAGPIHNREADDPGNAYLLGVDFSDATEADGIRHRRIDVAGARPLARNGKGAPLLRAIASGLKEAFQAQALVDGTVVGDISLFLTDALEDRQLVIAPLNDAIAILQALASLQATFREARESDNRFAALAATAPGVIYQRVVSPDGTIRYSYISENAFELFGVTAETILTDPEALFAHYGKDYRESFRQKLIQASKDMTVWDVEATIQRPDGQVRYTHAIARPQRRPDGAVVWTGVILDSTRMKLAEMATAAAEVRTRQALVESFSQGVLLFDADDRLTLRNSHFLNLYPELSELAEIGVEYQALLRHELDASCAWNTNVAAAADELRDRLARHGEPHLVYERELPADRHILVNEYRTPDGETVILYTDISELKRRERKIEHLAHHDALTGLPNRVLFHERLSEALAKAADQGEDVAVVCLDLDRFKSVNDTLGHHIGDILLQEVANRIRSVISEKETASRLGGDEFAVICPNLTDPDQATSLAWRLLDVLAQPHVIQDHAVVGGTSIGIAISRRDGNTPEVLLKNADLALYRAKSDGRGTFRFFEQEMDMKAQARRLMEVNLRVAIARNELEIHYQPLVDAHTSQIMGAEALLRWDMPGHGQISPDQFIPLAEETGLIGEIGNWVLQKACRDAAQWDRSIRIAVNLSPAQLRNTGFVEFVAKTLKETGLEADRLELEITEGMLLHNTETNTKALLDLKELGVRISMDDFGTGYSSLGNLRSFPFDKIKIDKSFISDLSKRPDAAAVIRAILTLGRSLGMTTTAEGVETRDQLAYLRAEGCMEVQGFYFAKPINNQGFCKMLANESPSAKMVSGVLTG